MDCSIVMVKVRGFNALCYEFVGNVDVQVFVSSSAEYATQLQSKCAFNTFNV